MDKDFVKKAILLPAITGVVLCAVFVWFMGSQLDDLVPINNNTLLAYHNEKNLPSEKLGADAFEKGVDAVSDNSLIGTINGETLRYNADYAALISSASLMPQSAVAMSCRSGCDYVKIIAGNADKFGSTVTVESDVFKNSRYALSDEYTVSSEQEVLMTSPKVKNSLVIYYQLSNGAGLTSDYKVKLYEEAV